MTPAKLEIHEGKELTPEHERLLALVEAIRAGQLEFLDSAGKRLIELGTALLGIIFAVIAFGDDFPPPYLAGKPLNQALALGTLACTLAALACGVLAVRPRRYPDYRANLSAMRATLERIIADKSRWVRAGHWIFFAALALLAGLVALLVLVG